LGATSRTQLVFASLLTVALLLPDLAPGVGA
jgi:hypothetical protein